VERRGMVPDPFGVREIATPVEMQGQKVKHEVDG
jgi:hypothetical protein